MLPAANQLNFATSLSYLDTTRIRSKDCTEDTLGVCWTVLNTRGTGFLSTNLIVSGVAEANE